MRICNQCFGEGEIFDPHGDYSCSGYHTSDYVLCGACQLDHVRIGDYCVLDGASVVRVEHVLTDALVRVSTASAPYTADVDPARLALAFPRAE